MDERMLILEFESRFNNVDIARAALQGISAECFAKESEPAADIVMAATEAMNNAVEHSGAKTIRVEVGWNDKALRVSVISDGPPFDPVTAAAKISEGDMLEREEGGYGLFLIRELVDRFDYEYRDGRNVWTLCKFTRSPKV